MDHRATTLQLYAAGVAIAGFAAFTFVSLRSRSNSNALLVARAEASSARAEALSARSEASSARALLSAIENKAQTHTQSSPPLIVYLAGSFLPLSDAYVHVNDRGFLFSDSVYEVFKLKGSFLFTEREHMARLRRGLRELRIDETMADGVPAAVRELARRNNLMESEAYAYIQISRGSAAPRAHSFVSGPVTPTVYIIVRPHNMPALIGASAILEIDNRWGRCDIKTTSLLANVLANTRAREAGGYEALLERDGLIVEASHSNVFAVVKDVNDDSITLITPPLVNILPGITRQLILTRGLLLDSTFIKESGLKGGVLIREGNINISDIKNGRITELICTASTSFVSPIVHIVGEIGQIGNGSVGPVAIALRNAWLRWWEQDMADYHNKKGGAPVI